MRGWLVYKERTSWPASGRATPHRLLALPALHTGNYQGRLGSERKQRLRTGLWPLSSGGSFADALVWDFPFTDETLSQ